MRPPCTNSSGRIHASAAPSDTSNAPQEVPKRTGSHGKRSMQHADYHNLETKRRKEGAESAAKVQERATQLVQQLAAPHGQDAPQETSGTLAKAEDRQNTYNMCIDTKPWATGRDRAVHATKSTAGLPMRTGHYESHASCRESFAPPSLENSRGDSPVEQTNSDPSVRSGASPVNAADQDSEAVSGQQQCRARSQSPPAGQLEFSSTQKFKRDSQCNESMGAIKDRQMNEQTLQNHPQNSPAHGKSLPPVIQKLQQAQQRAHDELEAAEKESSNYRFPAEAGQRFVTNARKHKAKLDVAVYEHGRGAHAHVTEY